MYQLDSSSQRKLISFKSPSQLKQAGKISSFFPVNRQDHTSSTLESKITYQSVPVSSLPIDTNLMNNRQRSSQYQKFMSQVKHRANRRTIFDNNPKTDGKTEIMSVNSRLDDSKPVSTQKIQLPRMDPGQSSQERQYNYFSPQQEFFLGRKPIKVNPIKLNQQQSQDTSRSILQSTRVDLKVTPHYESQQAISVNYKDFFSQVTKQESENENTVKLRKSMSSFHQNKEKPADTKMVRANSQYQSGEKHQNQSGSKKSTSEERIKVVDIFQEKRQNRDRLKTIVKNENHSSERKGPLWRMNPIEPEQQGTVIHNDPNYVSHLFTNRLQFSQEKDQLPSRQRLFSNKTPVKTAIIKQYFAPQQAQPRLNDSRDIMLNIQQRIQQRKSNDPATPGVKTNNLNKNKQSSQYLSINTAIPAQVTEKQETTPETQMICRTSLDAPLSQYYNDSPKLLETRLKPAQKPQPPILPAPQHEYQIQMQRKKPESVEDPQRSDRILDLLLLSTCELKNYFGQEIGDKTKKPPPSKKVRIAQSKQQFPTDFFNILLQK